MPLKKIKSEREIKTRKKRMQLAVGLVMIFLVLLSSAGFFASNLFGQNNRDFGQGILHYGGRAYHRQGDLLLLQMNNRTFYFFNLPNESRGIYLNRSNLAEYIGRPLYIVNNKPASSNIILNLREKYSRWQRACLNLENCPGNLPLKNCSDNIIAFVDDKENKVIREENCIFIHGNFERGVDAFSYNLLEIR